MNEAYPCEHCKLWNCLGHPDIEISKLKIEIEEVKFCLAESKASLLRESQLQAELGKERDRCIDAWRMLTEEREMRCRIISLLKRWIARGFPVGNASLYDETKEVIERSMHMEFK